MGYVPVKFPPFFFFPSPIPPPHPPFLSFPSYASQPPSPSKRQKTTPLPNFSPFGEIPNFRFAELGDEWFLIGAGAGAGGMGGGERREKEEKQRGGGEGKCDECTSPFSPLSHFLQPHSAPSPILFSFFSFFFFTFPSFFPPFPPQFHFPKPLFFPPRFTHFFSNPFTSLPPPTPKNSP